MDENQKVIEIATPLIILMIFFIILAVALTVTRHEHISAGAIDPGISDSQYDSAYTHIDTFGDVLTKHKLGE